MAASTRYDLASSRDDDHSHPDNLSKIFFQSDFYRRVRQLPALELYGVPGAYTPETKSAVTVLVTATPDGTVGDEVQGLLALVGIAAH